MSVFVLLSLSLSLYMEDASKHIDIHRYVCLNMHIEKYIHTPSYAHLSKRGFTSLSLSVCLSLSLPPALCVCSLTFRECGSGHYGLSL